MLHLRKKGCNHLCIDKMCDFFIEDDDDRFVSGIYQCLHGTSSSNMAESPP